jgi:hypothetical protein
LKEIGGEGNVAKNKKIAKLIAQKNKTSKQGVG